MRDHKGLNEIANVIRKDIVSMICKSKSGHPGGSLSAVEILTALYFDQMNIDPTNPKMEETDLFYLKVMQHQLYMQHYLREDTSIKKN